MKKREKKVVWLVTLPNGRKQEIDETIAQKYFLDDTSATPFSNLSIEKVVRYRTVTVPQRKVVRSTAHKRAAPHLASPSTRGARKIRHKHIHPSHGRRKVKQLRTVPTSASSAARRIRKS